MSQNSEENTFQRFFFNKFAGLKRDSGAGVSLSILQTFSEQLRMTTTRNCVRLNELSYIPSSFLITNGQRKYPDMCYCHCFNYFEKFLKSVLKPSNITNGSITILYLFCYIFKIFSAKLSFRTLPVSYFYCLEIKKL